MLLIIVFTFVKVHKNFKCASDFEGQEGEEDNNEELATIGGRARRLLIHN